MKALITLILLISSTAFAQPKYVPKVIPKCEVKELKDKTKGCVYTLEQVKKLYQADSELVMLRKTDALRQQKIAMQGSIIAKTLAQLKLAQTNVKLVTNRNKELTKQLIDTDKKLQWEIAKPRWGNYIVWGVAIALAASFGGYVIADQVSK
jgi:hypothetical protein